MIFCLVILALCMLFAYFSQTHTQRLAAEKGMALENTHARMDFWSIALIVILVFVCGLRIRYNDTATYIEGFLQSSTLEQLLTQAPDLGDCPGFLYFQAAVRSVTDNPHLFMMLCTALCIAPMLIFLKLYSSDFFFSVFLYVTAGQLLFSLAAIKQAIAISIAIWAIPLYLKKKYLWALLIILLAALFHPYVLLYLILPLLTGKPWGLGTLTVLGSIGAMAVLFGPSVQMMLEIAKFLGDYFGEQSFAGEGVNLLRVLMYAVVPALSLIFWERIQKREDAMQSTCINLSILSFGIMFLALFGTANLIGRVALYFSFSMSLSLPFIIGRMEKRSANSLGGIAMVLFFVYYLYENRNIVYEQISLERFLQSLLN